MRELVTFAEQYKRHAYADLIQEAETQGIGIGARAERERIITLLEAEIDPKVWDAQMLTIAWCVALIKGEEK